MPRFEGLLAEAMLLAHQHIDRTAGQAYNLGGGPTLGAAARRGPRDVDGDPAIGAGRRVSARRAAVPLGNAASIALVDLETAAITRFFTAALTRLRATPKN